MLFTIIRRNEKLAAKRSPMFDKNRFAKFLIYFMVAYWAALLLFMGVTLPQLLNRQLQACSLITSSIKD